MILSLAKGIPVNENLTRRFLTHPQAGPKISPICGMRMKLVCASDTWLRYSCGGNRPVALGNSSSYIFGKVSLT